MSDSSLTPDQDDAVRALLADARHTDPTPADVVARLDDTLASLTAERREVREVRAPVVTLASRRRRTAATVLLAAAAVVVAGVGIGQVVGMGTSGDDSSAGSAAETTTLDQAPTSADSDAAEPEASAESGSDPKQGDTSLRSEAAAPLAVNGLSSDSALRPQVRALRRSTAPSAFSADRRCLLPDAGEGEGELVAVTYNDLPGVLVYRAPVGPTQQVDLFLCGQPAAVRTLQLRAP